MGSRLLFDSHAPLGRPTVRSYINMNNSRAEIEQAIVNTVAYVDAFDYPLTTAEIHRYLIRLSMTPEALADTLRFSNIVPRRLRRWGDYYMLPGRERIMNTRRERQQIAERIWPSAVHYGRLISRMPFVRMVAVTGSLAVNNVGPHEDVDYLIVTANDRLWLCRAFVILIVRWAARHGLEICPNYFLTERALELSTRNLYTAHELTQMVPLSGLPMYHTLRRRNAWTQEFLPNAGGTPALSLPARSAMRQTAGLPLGRLIEWLLSSRVGQWLDQWEMGRKIRRFRRAYDGWEESEFSADCCKGHFNQHQRRTIQAYERLVAGEAADLEPDDPVKVPL
jgi:hypothetical protein